jgi:DNA-binding MarR family transcriptional regulator
VTELATADLAGTARTLARLARVLERACCELTLSQYRVLALVARGDERASKLAGRLALAKPTITAAVDALVEHGLVSRSGVEGDRRGVRLAVTAEGQAALARAEAAMAERLGPLISGCAHPGLVVQAVSELEQALDARLEARR